MIFKENYIPVQTKTVLYSGVTALYRGVVQYCTIQNIAILYPILASIKTKMGDIVLTFHGYIFSFDVHKQSKFIGGASKIKKYRS